MLASLLRALLESFEVEVKADGDGKKKTKSMTLSKGKDEFMKFFSPASERAKGRLKDDIEVIEPGDDVDDAKVELTNKSIYCTRDDGEVCGILDTERGGQGTSITAFITTWPNYTKSLSRRLIAVRCVCTQNRQGGRSGSDAIR